MKKGNFRMGNRSRRQKKEKIEVVFFPYKASMADSFETIYLAAKADPMCNAVWCPIPYFEKNPDGTYRKVCYEGELYPDKFEVTKWSEYDVEERHPDIIFIHNPYDQYNMVTSVHPDYFSSRLKDCTDLLVYVDYGMPLWIPSNAETAIGYQEQQVLSAQRNCHLFIGYSEEHAGCIRQLYAFSQQFPNIRKADDAKDSVVGLGSSKFDCVLRSRKEDFSLPEEWAEKIADKKVLLLNTSLAELLQSNEAHLNDIRSVIDAVSGQDELILWWRPHPLMESTIWSMRPSLAEEFYAIREKAERMGILDETNDLYRAIAYSDGLLSSESSLVYLYLATGKPFTMMVRSRLHTEWPSDGGMTFREPLLARIEHMKSNSNAAPWDWNGCVWWDNFEPEDFIGGVHYADFLNRFISYITHVEEYPEAEEYKELSLQLFHNSVANSDGTAGMKIYQYCKERATR